MFEESILREYDARIDALSALCDRVGEQLGAVLAPHQPLMHSITRRVKSRESLKEKLSRPDKIYRRLEDVTDLVGVRIVTYFDDATFEIAAAIERALHVHLGDSRDKRRQLSADQFGYRSLHYVCSLAGEQRSKDGVEAGVRFEIQIRTILQHAWAEIEHDLGYKSAASVPVAIRRRFSRLAGLLELADEEFLSIRKELRAYEASLRDRGPEALRRVSLDKVSLEAFVETEAVRRVDEAVSAQLKLPLHESVFFPEYLVQMLGHVGLSNVDDLERAVRDREAEVLAFVPHYFDFAQETWSFSNRNLDRVHRGYSLVFVAHLAVLESRELDLDRAEQVTDFFATLDYRGDRDRASKVALRLLEAYRRHLRERKRHSHG